MLESPAVQKDERDIVKTAVQCLSYIVLRMVTGIANLDGELRYPVVPVLEAYLLKATRSNFGA